MIKHIKKNLLDADVDIIIQCNNCFNTQGAGVALAIRKVYPEVFAEDCKTKSGDKGKLGTMLPVNLYSRPKLPIKYCFLCYGQYDMGGFRALNYEAIYRCLDATAILAKELKLKRIGIPYGIGCGLAGGDFRIVRSMIDVIFEKEKDLDVTICELP